ncbi:MAG: hypothetical protein ICV59_04960, partial [Thermoleophilia bacterium]|nr:hypothetical protein [Thermoleophilia bacterium]
MLRPPGEHEIDAVAALVNALSQSLYGDDAVTTDEVRRWFTSPTGDRERDFRVAELPDGRLGGFGSIADVAEDHSVIWLHLALHPELGTEQMGKELLAAGERRARERAAAGARIHAGTPSRDERAARLLEAHGYGLVRHFFRMLIVFDAAPPEPVWPPGFELRAFDVERDTERVWAADHEAFEDHWGFVRVGLEEWRHWMTTGEHFDPALWFIAYDGDEIAGFSLCRPRESGDPDMGWVSVLGVRRPWRRRG